MIRLVHTWEKKAGRGKWVVDVCMYIYVFMLGLDGWDRGELALGRGFVDGDGRRGEGRAISRTG